MIPVFAGFDRREAVGFHVFVASLMRRSSKPLAVTPLVLHQIAGYGETHGDGSNAFTYSRFLVPHLMGYDGWALYLDGSDMLVRHDIAALWALRDQSKAVQVVKHDYRSRAARKYIGTEMECANLDYPRKNWSSLMLINCAHQAWRGITPLAVEWLTGSYLHRFSFLNDSEIGALPPEWNHLVSEQPLPREKVKIAHFTLGIPAFEAYRDAAFAQEWRDELVRLMEAALCTA